MKATPPRNPLSDLLRHKPGLSVVPVFHEQKGVIMVLDCVPVVGALTRMPVFDQLPQSRRHCAVFPDERVGLFRFRNNGAPAPKAVTNALLLQILDSAGQKVSLPPFVLTPLLSKRLLHRHAQFPNEKRHAGIKFARPFHLLPQGTQVSLHSIRETGVVVIED